MKILKITYYTSNAKIVITQDNIIISQDNPSKPMSDVIVLEKYELDNFINKYKELHSIEINESSDIKSA